MKKRNTLNIIVLISLFLWYVSCATFRQEMYVVGGESEMIHNAVLDFVNTEKRLLHKHNLFCVQYDSIDPFQKRVCIYEDDKSRFSLMVELLDWSNIKVYFRETDLGKTIVSIDTVLNKPAMIVSFTATEELQSIWFDESLVKQSYDAFPDAILEWEDNVFYWTYSDSDNNPVRHINEKIIESLYLHHYVDTNVWCYWSGFLSEYIEGKEYLFTNNDLRKYNKRSIRKK